MPNSNFSPKQGAKVFKQTDELMDNMSIQKNLRETLKPILEEWCKKLLASDITIYGIRRYLRGAWLSLHVDKLPTHIISAILQVRICYLDKREGHC